MTNAAKSGFPAFHSDLGRMRMLAGHRALDFANSLHWRDDGEVDFTRNYEELVRWSVPAGILNREEADRLLQLANEERDQASQVHRGWHDLRAALKAFLEEAVRSPGRRASRLAASELAAKLSELASQVAFTGSEGAIVVQCREELALPLVRTALAAAELLGSDGLASIRQCEADPCGGFFVDESRGTPRRWCAMDSCGNRAKVRRHRQRLRDAPAAGKLPGKR
jgi:predicted RNA-binding Zn ribbon-like protein